MNKSGGSSAHYTGPGSSLRQNKAVGVGQATPPKAKSEKKEEKTEAKAEKKENSAIKQLQSAQKMEKGVGAGGPATSMKGPGKRGSYQKIRKAGTRGIPPQIMPPPMAGPPQPRPMAPPMRPPGMPGQMP